MATVTGITADKATEILGESVVAGEIDVDGNLILTKNNGETFPAGAFMDIVSDLVQEAIFEKSFPIGCIHISVNPANPSTTLGGGVWASWGSGRVPVGVDGTQSEFNAVEETGGAKSVTLTTDQMPSHNHTQNAHSHSMNHDHSDATTGSSGAHSHTLYSRGGGSTADLGSYPRIKRSSPDADPSYQSSDLMEDGSGVHNHSVNIPAYTGNTASTTPTNNAAGGGQSHNNLQPYITCYMWKRTG